MTQTHILNACRAAFRERKGLSVTGLNPLQSNQHPMVAFHLTWDGAPGGQTIPLIFRRYPGPLSWHTLDASGRAAREFAVLRWLGRNRFPVPPALATGSDEGGDWLLIGTLAGRNWWRPLGGVDFEKVLPGIVRQAVALMARLHAFDAAELSDVLPTITLAGVIEGYRQAVEEAGDPLLKAALRRLADLASGIEEAPPRLINVDAELTNLLVDQSGNVVAWLDWDDAALGDPRWDVAALVNSLRGAYQMNELAARAVADYGRETVRPVRDLEVWVALYAVLRWAQAVWLKEQIENERPLAFPALERFVAACDSHRAWAMEMLKEAEEGGTS